MGLRGQTSVSGCSASVKCSSLNFYTVRQLVSPISSHL